MKNERDVWATNMLEGMSDDPKRARAEPMDRRICSTCSIRAAHGQAKGIIHTTGGYMAARRATHHYIFDVKPLGLLCAATSAG